MLDVAKIILVTATIAVFSTIQIYYPDYRHSNPVEQAIDKIVEYETGVHIDLTPLDPPKKS